MTDYLSKKIKILSFLAIIFVVFQHAINFTGYIDPNSSYIGKANINTVMQYVLGYGFARIAVCLFFLLSAYLFYRNFALPLYGSKLISRVRILLVPYLLWSSIGMVCIWILQSIPLFTGYFSSLYTGLVIHQPFSYYVKSIVNHGVSFQLWFLTDLMVYTLMAPIIYLSIKYISIFLILPAFLLWLFAIPLPPLFSFLYRGGFFYLLGAYIAIHRIGVAQEKIKQIALFAVISWIIVLFIKTLVAFGLLQSVWLSLQQIDNMAIALGICAIWFLYDVWQPKKLMETILFCTPFTFFLYASHEPLLEIVKRVEVGIVGFTDWSLMVLYGGSVIIVVLLTLGAGWLLKRFLPKLFGILTGGR